LEYVHAAKDDHVVGPASDPLHAAHGASRAGKKASQVRKVLEALEVVRTQAGWIEIGTIVWSVFVGVS
jgi:hypothetical protein